MLTRLGNLKRAGFFPRDVIDVGAFEGEWTADFWKVWPDAPVTMIEPLPEKRALLEDRARSVPGSRALSLALDAKAGEARFQKGESNSRIVRGGQESADEFIVVSTTLDQTSEHGLSPNLLKLDVQGHELEVLKGGTGTIQRVEVLILEISVLKIGEVPIFREVDRYLETLGFRLYDLLPQYYRPLDGALWQVDAFYVKEGSRLIESRAWNS